jgi:hypothetical protein
MDEVKQQEHPIGASGSVKVDVKRHEDYTTLYANYIVLEPSFWDLKMYFGEIDQSTVPPSIEVHTGMNISWPLAKILSYILQAHLTGFEAQHGKIKLPSEALPPEWPQPPSDDPNAAVVHAKLKKLREELTGG